MSTRPTTAFADLPRLAQVCTLLLGVAALALSVRLWPDWRRNPDLSHGLFMPIVFAVLIAEARQGTPRFLRRTAGGIVGTIALLAVGIAALFIAGLYAASVDWSHPLVNDSLAFALACFLGAGLLVLADDGLRFMPLNWTAVIAIGLWLFCVPLPPGTYTRLTMTLQMWVSEGVLRTLHMLGIAALRHGNIIELGDATVGVEEACSGVRSLISCVFAGLFFSATLVRRGWARAVIIGLSAPLALLMNFVRSLTLTLLVNAGININGMWHDLTGFAVLGITALLLAGLAFLLERLGGRVASEPPRTKPNPHVPATRLMALLATMSLAGVLVFFSIVNTRPSIRRDAPAPDLNALLPAAPSGWQVETSTNLYQFSTTLQTDHLAQRIYRKPMPDGSITEIILYAAYWHPGQAPVSLVASHTPDACLPGAGWVARPVPVQRQSLKVDDRVLPSAEYRLFTYQNFPQHVWYWHIYDGRPIEYRDPYSAVELLRIALRYGFRHDGDQVFVRVSSNRTWAEIQNEPLLADFFNRSRGLGL